jgi:hypothetical protein
MSLKRLDTILSSQRGVMGYTWYDRLVIYSFLILCFSGFVLAIS